MAEEKTAIEGPNPEQAEKDETTDSASIGIKVRADLYAGIIQGNGHTFP